MTPGFTASTSSGFTRNELAMEVIESPGHSGLRWAGDTRVSIKQLNITPTHTGGQRSDLVTQTERRCSLVAPAVTT